MKQLLFLFLLFVPLLSAVDVRKTLAECNTIMADSQPADSISEQDQRNCHLNGYKVVRFHATACDSLTDGVEGDICYQQSDSNLYSCEPTAGGCDTAGEWSLLDHGLTTAGAVPSVSATGELEESGYAWDGAGTGPTITKAGTVLFDVVSSDNGVIQWRMMSTSDNRRIVAIDASSNPKSQILFGDVELVFAGISTDTNEWLTLSDTAAIFMEALDLEDPGTQPTCDSTTRGYLFFDEGAGGVADTLDICAKDTGDAYAWRSIY